MRSRVAVVSVLLLMAALPLSGQMSGGESSGVDYSLDPAGQTVIASQGMDFYSGTVVLDSQGEAWVSMPSFFEAQNRAFSYQLTAIGASAPGLYIAQKITDSRFKIAGGKSGMEVSWQVTGMRQEALAANNNIPVEKSAPVEEEKRAPEIAASKQAPAPVPASVAKPKAANSEAVTTPSASSSASVAKPKASSSKPMTSASAATPPAPSSPSVANPAVSSPVASTPAAVTATSVANPVALTSDDIAIIKDMLERQFKVAFESRRMSEMQRVWPDMPRVARKDIANLFQSSDIQDIRMDLSCQPAVSADNVLAYCSQTFSFSVGRQAHAPLQHSVVYRLTRTDGEWHLEESRRGLGAAPRGLSD